MTRMVILLILTTACAVVAAISGTETWTTCGGLKPAYNRTACPLDVATCCEQKWMPSEKNYGCAPYPNAVCCSNGYTSCPSGHTCVDSGKGWAVVTKCEKASIGAPVSLDTDPDANLGAQVCKTGGPLPFDANRKNVVIMGDSVSIGYEPFIAAALADVALVQHSPWGGDGGAEETEYGFRCLEYLLRAPDGTPQVPDVLFFNWGLHNIRNSTVPGQAGPIDAYAPWLDKIAARLAALAPTTNVLFGLTSPMLCNAALDDVVVANNRLAAAIMARRGIPTVDMHAAITGKCGPVPQASCFGSHGCFCPHCPAHGGAGYSWLANSLLVPAIRKALGGG